MSVEAVIFDVDGTLVDSVDLHALAWCDAFARFGHEVAFGQVRGQIGKGGDKLIPVFLDEAAQADHGETMESWRSAHFKERYLPMVRPFAAVPALLAGLREAGLRIAVGSSAKAEELASYLRIAEIEGLVDVRTSSEDVSESKPAPDVFGAARERLGLEAAAVMVVGDTPYDAEAARRAGIESVGVLSGGFLEVDLRAAGCLAVYPGPAALFACLRQTPLLALAVEPQSP